MTHQILVSVVIPVFNSEQYVFDSIQSVLKQSIKVLEIVVVDDGSTDQTKNIVKNFGHPVRLVEQDNSGPASARNNGVKNSKGQYIAFLDSDDIWHHQKLEKQLNSLKKFPNRLWCYTDVEFLGGINDGRKDSEFTTKFDGDILSKIMQNNFIGTSSVLIKKTLFWDAGGFNSSLRYVEDWEFWAKVAMLNDVCFVDEPLVQYRIHGQSTSRNVRQTFPFYMQVIDNIYENFQTINSVKNANSHQRGSTLKAKADACLVCSYIAEEEGDKRFALYCAWRALVYDRFSTKRCVRFVKCIVKFLIPNSSPRSTKE